VSASLLEQTPELEMYLFKRISSDSAFLGSLDGPFLKDFTFSGCGLKFLSFDFPLKDPEEDDFDWLPFAVLPDPRSCRPLDELFFAVICKFFAKVRNHFNK
jgi:hypothetical protein